VKHEASGLAAAGSQPARCDVGPVICGSMSSLKERAGVKRGWPAVLRWLRGLQGREEWPHGWFPLAGALSCEPGGGSGTGRSPAAVAAPQASLTRRPASPIMAGPGESRRRGNGGYAVVVAPSCRCAAWQARWLPSSLRDARPGWPGPHGAVRVSPGAGQSHSRPRRRGGGHTFARPRARPGRQLTPPDGKRGGRARRAGRRTPGSAAPGPPRSWRCSGLPSRGGPGSPP